MQHVLPLQQLRRYRRVIIGVALTLAVLLGLTIWGVIAGASWLLDKAPQVSASGQQVLTAAREKIEEVAPQAKERVQVWLPSTNPAQPAAQDVSGSDLGPASRMAGLVRTRYTETEALRQTVYEGKVDYQATLQHYLRGFDRPGMEHHVLSAAPGNEQHSFRSGQQQWQLDIQQLADSRVSVSLSETTLK